MRGEYGLMADADAATDISDLDRLMLRMKDVERTSTSSKGPVTHGMVLGSRAHMEGEAVAKVMKTITARVIFPSTVLVAVSLQPDYLRRR